MEAQYSERNMAYAKAIDFEGKYGLQITNLLQKGS